MDDFIEEIKQLWPLLIIAVLGYLIYKVDIVAFWAFKIFLGILPVAGTLFLAYIAHAFWLHYVQASFIAGIEWVVLEIVPPRDVLRSPQAMELFLTNALYHWSKKGGLETYWQGAVWFWFSLEIVSIDGQVHFYIRAPSRVKGLIETQMYAQYPQAQVKEVEDYTLAVDKITANSKYNLWGCEFKYTKPDAYPIKTYVDFKLDKDPKEEYKVDPISPVIELFGSITKGEQMWMQIVITPSKKTYPEHAYFWQKKHDWVAESELAIRKSLKEFTGQRDIPGKPGQYSKEIRAPGFMDAMVKGAGAKFLKVGFDTGIRICYLAEREKFNMSNRRNIRLIFRQYAAPFLNELYRINSTQADAFASNVFTGFFLASKKSIIRLSNRMLEEYREREFFHPPLRHKIRFPWPISPYIFPNYFHHKILVMNTEELATLWHFPGQILKVPTLERIESKEASPPTNLPT
jgi:hypothetical protein